MRNVGEMTLMSHFAQADHPEGIGEAMRRGCAGDGRPSPFIYRYHPAATLWHPFVRIMTGSGRVLFCTARRRQDNGGILPIPG